PSCRLGLDHGWYVCRHGLLCHGGAKDSRNREERRHSMARGSGLYSRSRNGADSDPGSHGFEAAECWRESAWHRRRTFRRCAHHCRRLWRVHHRSFMADQSQVLGASMRKLLVLLALASIPCLAQSDRQWVLDSSTLAYHVSHPLHELDGVSHAALGKGVCHAGQCDFLVAVQVKTFDTGDSNRDLHMLQVTQGAQFPIVSVRFRLPESALSSATVICDLEIQFAGQTAHFQKLAFQQVIQGNEH